MNRSEREQFEAWISAPPHEQATHRFVPDSPVWPDYETELPEILRLHSLWQDGDEGGKRADLSGSDLRHADLSGSDLRDANLTSSDLRHANLTSCDLRDADLRRVIGNQWQIRSAQIERWPIVWTQSPQGKTIVSIGCQTHALETWESATDSWIVSMDRHGLGTWLRLRDPMLALIKASPAVPWVESAQQEESGEPR